MQKHDREFLKKPKKGSLRRLTTGGSVFLDRDYSRTIKSKSVKNILIFLGLLPIFAGITILWMTEQKVVAVILGLATLVFSWLAIFIIKKST